MRSFVFWSSESTVSRSDRAWASFIAGFSSAAFANNERAMGAGPSSTGTNNDIVHGPSSETHGLELNYFVTEG